MSKKNKIKPWQNYENSAYDLFRSTGYPCQRNIVLPGARGSHQIDILVNLNILIGDHTWLVECKNWSRPVGKRELLSFKSVIDDIGADHGYLLSENGFQKGAHEMARSFNISLFTLAELQEKFIRDQLLPSHQQSNEFNVIVKYEEDWGNMDSEAIVELAPTNDLSVYEYLIEIHVISEVVSNCIISKEKAKKFITPHGSFCFSLPWDLSPLCGMELETIPMEGGGFWMTGNNKAGVNLDRSYRIVFRTLTGPVSVNTYVPMFK